MWPCRPLCPNGFDFLLKHCSLRFLDYKLQLLSFCFLVSFMFRLWFFYFLVVSIELVFSGYLQCVMCEGFSWKVYFTITVNCSITIHYLISFFKSIIYISKVVQSTICNQADNIEFTKNLSSTSLRFIYLPSGYWILIYCPLVWLSIIPVFKFLRSGKESLSESNVSKLRKKCSTDLKRFNIESKRSHVFPNWNFYLK